MDAHALTLRRWYDAHFRRLFQPDARSRTVDEYRYSLTAWEKHTRNPVLSDVTMDDLASFRAAAAAAASPASANKHLRHLNALLAKAGPPGPHNRDALSLIPSPPWVRQLRVQLLLPRFVSDREINAVYSACSSATWPATSPASYWRALVVLAYNLGYRRGVLLSLGDRSFDWREGTCRAAASVDKRGRERIKPCNDVVMRHVLPLRGRGDLFGVPRRDGDWYATWRRIVDVADVAHFGLHDLKRTCGTVLSRFASTWQVRYMLDHASSDVTSRYVNPLEELRSVVDRMPQPASFVDEPGLRLA